MYSKMINVENEIRELNYELAYVIDRQGNLYKAEGDCTNVVVDGIDVTDAIIIHNHPEIDGFASDSFGKDDFMFLAEHPEIKEFRAVNARYSYKLRLLKPLDVTYHEAEHGGLEFALESGNYEEPQHNAMNWLKKKGYIAYERTEFDEI